MRDKFNMADAPHSGNVHITQVMERMSWNDKTSFYPVLLAVPITVR